MSFRSTLRHALPRSALLLLALWGPGAMAALRCTPLVGDVTAGATQTFRVTNAQEQVCRGTWSIGGVNDLGAWVDEGADHLGTVTVAADGVMEYRAPELASPARALLRFTPDDAQEVPIEVPVRLWLRRAPTHQASAAASSPTSPARADLGGAAGPVGGVPSPEGKKRKFKSYPPDPPGAPSKHRRFQPPAAAGAGEAFQTLAPSGNTEAGEAMEEMKEREDGEPATPGPAPAGSASSPLEAELVTAALLEDEARPAIPDSAGGAASAHAASALPSPPLVAFAGGQPTGSARRHLRQKSLIAKHHKMHVDFRVEKTLGAGSSASVIGVEIENPSKGDARAEAAAKVWDREAPPWTKTQLAKIEKILLEVNHMKQLETHPNVIQFLGFSRSDRHYFIIMELAETNLAKVIAKLPAGQMPEERIRNYAWQLLKGLDHIHRRNLVHGDLKGLNVLLTNEDQVIKIADFGSAQSCPDGEKIPIPDNLKGCTPAWAAPELLDPRRGYDKKADIWSYACVLLEMLSGKAPWHGQNIQSLSPLVQQLTFGNAPAIPAHASQGLRELIGRCLNREPEQRPDTQDLLKDGYFAEIAAKEAAPTP